MIIYNPNLKVFYPTLINDPKSVSYFGTKQTGDGRDIKNIKNFLKQVELFYERIIVPGQIHSTNIAVIKGKGLNIEKLEGIDGLITQDKGVVLSVITADCLPIVYIDKIKGLIGISHQGWKGSLKKLAVKMIEKMLELGSNKKDILVAIGPGIGACCYDIQDDRYLEFLVNFKSYTDKIFIEKQNKKYLNLNLLNYLLLTDKAGIKATNIEYFPFCTSCDSKRFFSARKGAFARQFSFVVQN